MQVVGAIMPQWQGKHCALLCTENYLEGIRARRCIPEVHQIVAKMLDKEDYLNYANFEVLETFLQQPQN